MSRFDTVKTLKLMGFNITPEWDKRPILKGWNERILTLEELRAHWIERDWNIGIIVGEYSKGRKFCVIDVDEEGRETWDKFVEENDVDTNTLTCVTPNNGLHLYYECNFDLRNGHFLTGVEMKSKGCKITAPTSETPEGKRYHWDRSKSTKMKHLPQTIYDVIKDKNNNREKVDFDVKNIQQGRRNEALYKMACSLRNKYTEYDIFYHVVAGLNSQFERPLDDYEAERIIKSAWSIQTKKSSLQEYIDFYNERYIVLILGGKTVIYNKNSDNSMSFTAARDFHLCDMYEYVDEGDPKGTVYKKNAFETWIRKNDIVRAEGLVFKPDLPSGFTPDRMWNVWKGFEYEAKKGDCSLFLEHTLENICDNDEGVYDFLMDWMAQIIQRPMEKNYISVAVKGDPGSGKTAFVHHYLKLFGKSGVEINDSEQLTHQFNSILMNKLLVYGDEAFWSGNRKDRGKLKNLISSNRVNITFKGKETIEMDNHMRFVFTTNNDWTAPVENGDRRWMTLRCGNARRKDNKYFQKMDRQMNEGGYEALMYILQNREISDRDWSAIPMTEARREDMKLTSLRDNFVYDYLSECLDEATEYNCLKHPLYPEDTFENHGVIVVGHMLDQIVKWARHKGLNTDISGTLLGMRMKKMGLVDSSKVKKIGGKCVRVYQVGKREEVIEKLEKMFD